MLCTGCDGLVEEINSYQLHPEKRTIINTQRTQPRYKTPKKLCVIGGLSGFDSPDRYLNSADYFYLEDEEKWQEMAPMCVARESAGMRQSIVIRSLQIFQLSRFKLFIFMRRKQNSP